MRRCSKMETETETATEHRPNHRTKASILTQPKNKKTTTPNVRLIVTFKICSGSFHIC